MSLDTQPVKQNKVLLTIVVLLLLSLLILPLFFLNRKTTASASKAEVSNSSTVSSFTAQSFATSPPSLINSFAPSSSFPVVKPGKVILPVNVIRKKPIAKLKKPLKVKVDLSKYPLAKNAVVISYIKQYFPKDQWLKAEAVSTCESGMTSNVVSLPNADKTHDWGVFQLNDGGTLQHLLTEFHYPLDDLTKALDPKWNVQAADLLWSQRGWQPWTCAAKLGFASGATAKVKVVIPPVKITSYPISAPSSSAKPKPSKSSVKSAKPSSSITVPSSKAPSTSPTVPSSTPSTSPTLIPTPTVSLSLSPSLSVGP